MKKIVVYAVCLLVLFLVARVVVNSGMLRNLEWQAYGQCEQVPGFVGAEDITIDRQRNVAYIGTDDRRDYLRHGDQSNTPNGALWRLDLNQQGAMPTLMQHDFEGVFHPHGIAYYANAGKQYLYVINHITTTEHEIDIFEITAPDRLSLQRRVQYDALISPNDLVVVGPEQFYVTNDHAYPRHTFMEKLEDYLGLALASVTYFDGEQGSIVIDGLQYPNGIAISPNGRWMLIAETTARGISRYERGADASQWQFKDFIALDAGVDNLEWQSDGSLLTAAHPKILDFVAHMLDADKPSPSEVIRITLDQESMQAETVMLDDGQLLSGASVATMAGQTLFVGSVFEPHFLRCTP